MKLLCSTQKWAHWLVFGLVFAELVYEVLMTYDYMEGKFKPSGFWRRMLDNFVIVCLFLPAFLCFWLMRVVAKSNIEKNERNKGRHDVEFAELEESSKV